MSKRGCSKFRCRIMKVQYYSICICVSNGQWYLPCLIGHSKVFYEYLAIEADLDNYDL